MSARPGVALEPPAESRAALLREALARHRARRDPVRTLHHLACTGGTLLAKCIAALPNVQLLSEIDPLSPLVLPDAQAFSPTDMVTLLRQSTRGTRRALLVELFRQQVTLVHGDAERQGLHLVLRDHAHGHFCHGPAVPERPALRELLPPDLPVLSLVTVRHPLDGYASLRKNGWVHFTPGTLDEYCRRTLAFLDRHAGVPLLRYEDFVADPQPAMQRVCQALQLRHVAHFAQHFAGFRVSGDSGRSGATIAPRPSQPAAVQLEAEAAGSAAYQALVERLGYGLRAGTLSGA